VYGGNKEINGAGEISLVHFSSVVELLPEFVLQVVDFSVHPLVGLDIVVKLPLGLGGNIVIKAIKSCGTNL
jgi:hypothetical protein